MKKSLIAFAVLGAFASVASAQSSVVLYGIVDLNTTYLSNQTTTGGKKMSMDSSGLSSSRWGFKGSEDLGNGLKANFQLESSLNADSGTAGSLFDRIATVGLSGSLGTVNAGRQTNLAYDTLIQVDPIGVAHVGTNPNIVFGALNNTSLYGPFGTSVGASSATRQNNSIKYAAPSVLGGIVFSGMYGFGEKAGDAQASSYMGTSATFSEGGLTAVFSYSQLRDATSNVTLRAYTGGAKFVVNKDVVDGLTLKVTYAENEVNTTGRNIGVFGLGADFAVTPATTLTTGYYNTRRSGDVKGKVDTFVVLGKYAFSKRTAAYASFTYAKAGSALAKDTDIGLIMGAGNRSGVRTSFGVNHAF
ncbi:porin [Undibacterium danionis]|uniref:Porin n=1 Tax=Undibacterium danionis TaxID=1812100 RepID=A0ABV6IJJ4_9BURK